MNPLAYLYLDLNSFFASVEQQLSPELRGKPVAVVPALTDATCAIATSYEAKAHGIKTGTRIYEAKALCPQLICVPAQHERYVYFHGRIRACLEQFLPIYKAESIDEFSCQLDSSQQSQPAARALALRIKAAMQEQIGAHIRSSIGIGPNRFLAKTASNLQKPDGLQVLYAEDMPARMKDVCPSELVGIGHAMSRRLKRAGIFTIEQLYGLAPKQMRALWGGVLGERFYYKLRGIELPDEPTTRRHVGHSHILEPGWRDPALAQQVMRRLLLKAASRMRRLGYDASALSIAVRLEGEERIRYEAGSHFAACCDNPRLQREMLRLWDEIMHTHRPRRLKKVSLTLHGLSPHHARQHSLLDSLTPQAQQHQRRAEHLSEAMDTLNHRFGRDTVTMGSLPNQVRSFTGTKVAFTRIPQQAEFFE